MATSRRCNATAPYRAEGLSGHSRKEEVDTKKKEEEGGRRRLGGGGGWGRRRGRVEDGKGADRKEIRGHVHDLIEGRPVDLIWLWSPRLHLIPEPSAPSEYMIG